MGIQHILKDPNFNIIFSLLIGIGFICMVRPQCKGVECNVNKPPVEEDFDKYVYRMQGGKCYEFKTQIVKCPLSGTIEAFTQCPQASKLGRFMTRNSVIKQ
jgi:hypothetical protein